MTNESESRLQQSCYMHFHNSYPHLRGLFFKIKNEGTNRITGARDKATGLIAGVADSCLLIPQDFELGQGFQFEPSYCVFIEFKTETGKQSPAQKAWEATVKAAGYQYHVIKTLEQFKELLKLLDL